MPASNTRWVILGLMFGVSSVAYLHRLNFQVAAEAVGPDLGLSLVQMGWVFAAFNYSYAFFQFPGGIWGGRLGSRLSLTIIALAWTLLTLLTGFLPGLAATSTVAIIGTLIGLRFLMGIVQAPLFPAMAGTIAAWFPVSRWAFPNAAASSGLNLGAAATTALVAWMLEVFGWRNSLYLTAPLGVPIIALWWWYVRDKPAQHGKANDSELALINADRPPPESMGPEKGAWKRLLRNRETLLLTFSYFCMNYVFYVFFQWFFIYLVNERGFGILGGGLFASVPWVSGAIAAAIGGEVCDRLCKRIGPRWGCRLPCMGGLLLVAIFVLAGATAPNPYVAITFLSLGFAFTQFTDGAYWSGATFVAGPHTSAASGILNTGGNLPGIVSGPLIPFLAAQFGWRVALSTGSLFAVVGAVVWLFIRVDQPLAGGTGSQ